jgi:hypothetical protein
MRRSLTVLALGHPIGLGLARLLFVLVAIIGVHGVGPHSAGAHPDLVPDGIDDFADPSNRPPQQEHRAASAGQLMASRPRVTTRRPCSNLAWRRCASLSSS